MTCTALRADAIISPAQAGATAQERGEDAKRQRVGRYRDMNLRALAAQSAAGRA
jgi:hypothetical protein